MDIKQLTRIPVKVTEVETFQDDNQARIVFIVEYLNGDKDVNSVYGATKRRPDSFDYDYTYAMAYEGMGTIDYSEQAREYMITALNELRIVLEGLNISSEEFVETVLNKEMYATE